MSPLSPSVLQFPLQLPSILFQNPTDGAGLVEGHREQPQCAVRVYWPPVPGPSWPCGSFLGCYILSISWPLCPYKASLSTWHALCFMHGIVSAHNSCAEVLSSQTVKAVTANVIAHIEVTRVAFLHSDRCHSSKRKWGQWREHRRRLAPNLPRREIWNNPPGSQEETIC